MHIRPIINVIINAVHKGD